MARVLQNSYSACHPAFSRAIEAADCRGRLSSVEASPRPLRVWTLRAAIWVGAVGLAASVFVFLFV